MKTKYKFREKFPVKRDLPVKSNYEDYRGDLRQDFFERCGYCDDPDHFRGGYHIDHFAPQVDFGHLTNDYSNLIYSCPVCNMAKGRDWVTDSCDISCTDSEGYINPCEETYDNNFERDEFGEIVALTPVAEYMYLRLKFYLPRHSIYWNLYRIDDMIQKLTQLVDKYPENQELQKCKQKLQDHFSRYFNQMRSL